MVTEDSSQSGTRTNAQWLQALLPPPGDQVVAELRALVRRRLGRSLRSYGIDDSSLDDFTQEATLRVMSRLQSFRGDSRFSTWVHTLAVRVAFSELRRRRAPTQPIDELVEAAGSRASDVSLEQESQELIATLKQAIETELTPRQRTVILGELSGLSSEGVAEQLGTNRNAVYKVYHDARQKLRTALVAAGYGEEDVRTHLDRASERKE